MPTVRLTTYITAGIETVFNLSRDIDIHQVSMEHSNEKAIGGVTHGLIEKGQTVTWQAKHLGKTRTLTSIISEMQPYSYFVDEMVEGDFKSFKHEHFFTEKDGITTVVDVFCFQSPYGVIGKLANALFLTSYMKQLLQKRNNIIKQIAEKQV